MTHLRHLRRAYGMAAPASRGDFSQVSDKDFNAFSKIVGDNNILTDPTEMEGYNTDWLGKYSGKTQLVLRPGTTEEVSEIVKYCNERNLAIVPQGGNTGLVGGSVPVHDEIVLTMNRMNHIIDFDEVNGVVTCEAGCVLQVMDEWLKERNHIMPLDLGAKGSCHIGGNLSTNAGGLRFLRYGSLHGNTLGIEAVTGTGEVLDLLRTLKKDNTGYDLKQLFIGSEGTLGIVTKLALHVPAKPASVQTAMLACEKFTDVLDLMKMAKHDLGEILSAFEFIDSGSMDLVEKYLEKKNPFDSKYPFYCVVETQGSNAEHDMEKIATFLERGMEDGPVLDGIQAQDVGQANHIWDIREGVAESLKRDGYCYKYDVSIPVDRLYDLVVDMRERCGDLARWVVGYGHVGDGNLHLNITSDGKNDELLARIEPFVYEWVNQHQGSVSAEHGIGYMKPGALHYSKDPLTIDYMRRLKQVFDPKGILNPYKVLPVG
eukprot:Clim_evm11s53 gene=Clim_evmTU11s53